MVGPVKFITVDAVPMLPVVEHHVHPDGVWLRAYLTPAFLRSQHGSPSGLDDPMSYWETTLPVWKWDLLPEGCYDIDDQGEVTNITAPTLDRETLMLISDRLAGPPPA